MICTCEKLIPILLSSLSLPGEREREREREEILERGE
jgi:hypothetical protein